MKILSFYVKQAEFHYVAKKNHDLFLDKKEPADLGGKERCLPSLWKVD